jgi:hypothetical protein
MRIASGQLLLELPIYRCTQDAYEMKLLKDHQSRMYSIPPWDYNYVIAWVQLFGLPDYIKGYLWHQETSRRPRRTIMVCDGNKDLELPIVSQSSSDVYHELRSKLLDVCQEHFGPRCHIDLEAFDAIGPAVDWRAVLRGSG